MKRYFILLAGILIFTVMACKKEKLSDGELHDITSVAGPATGAVNTDIVLTVTYPFRDGCDAIERFEENRSGKTVIIKGITRPVAKDAFCTQNAGMRTIEYKFKASSAGTYELRFLKPDNTTVNHTITLQ
ncbi:MAG: hypothetical protein EOO10_01990 [Chitinophagaceae bacterium]|nr:MAG: hypothetical protein EOO10_01990 [Chitinophagaceae bacterium]